MAIIAGIDPGETTGVCVINENVDGNDFQVVWVGQIPWEKRVSFFQALFCGTFTYGLVGEPLLPEIVVIESFILRPGRAMEQVGSKFPSVRVIGIIEAFISLCVRPPLLVFQQPSEIGRVEIRTEHQEQLKGLIHAQDAYRHARYYFVTTRRS